MEKNLSEMSIVELKALAYDFMAQIEFSQQNLRNINLELSKRFDVNKSQDFPVIPQGSIQSV